MSPAGLSGPRRRYAAGGLLALAAVLAAASCSQPSRTSVNAGDTPPLDAQSGSPTTPKVAFTDIRWQNFYGVQLPVHLADGPRVMQDDLAFGFGHTPRGALLAALHIGVRANAQWGPDIFEPTINNQVVGPDRDALLAVCRDSYEQASEQAGVTPGEPLGRAYVVLEAYRWQGYTPHVASVDIVSAGPSEQGVTARAATRIDLQWRDGDWKVVAPPGGDWGNSATRITSLDGYPRLPERG